MEAGLTSVRSDVTPGMNAMRAKKIRATEQEFGEPFWEVVRGLAQMGCSRKEAAGVIGYDREAFCLLIRSRPDISWAPYQAMRGVRDRQITDQYKQAIALSNKRRARRYFVRGRWRTISELAEMAGITPSGMWWRLTNGWHGEALFAPKVSPLERGIRGAAVTNSKKNPRHIWRRKASF